MQHGMGIAERQAAYRADITYATAKEAGFDLLRMQLVRDPSQVVHRPLHFALVDEADSILIDEARVPLVIAGQRLDSGAGPERVAAAIAALTPGQDFETDENARNVFLTERGCDRLEASLDAGDLYDASNATLLSEVHQALHARVLLRRDVDYLVREDKVELVDVFTGRVVRDRRWPDGLQAAVEAKEGVPVQPGGRILGTLTLQHLLETYDVLSGMTATAVSAAEELQGFYGLKVVVIPESRPCVREDLPDLVFSHRQARDAALIRTILEVHGSGRPLLVGTTSVEDSERLSSQLLDHGIPHQVLNARNDTQEASIIAEAGGLGAVTISTNMAGRGTDIRLGGADERDREQVVALGGLYVIGTSRHESRRIDNQLQGRAGRQGDPGTSRFFVHLEDDLMLRFGLEGLLGGRYIATRQDGPIDHPVVRREIARLQRIVEGQHYDIRRTLWKYASVVRDQSQAIQEIRIEALIGSLSSTCREQAPAKWRQLCDALGTEAVEAVERQITLHHIDRAWEAHLALTSEMRESIHLVKLAGDPPLETFRKRTLEAYWALEAGLEAQIVATFKDLTIQNGQVDLAEQGLTPPGATWTYLVDDQGPGGMGFAGVKRVTAGLSALLGSPWATLRRWWLGHS